MSHTEIILIAALVLLVVLVTSTFFGKKARKFKITVADTIYEVTRNRWDALEDEKDLRCYHKADGKKIWFSSHFTITKEEL
jgi:ABC-type multidrug transport system fused ATPase/permease subunit